MGCTLLYQTLFIITFISPKPAQSYSSVLDVSDWPLHVLLPLGLKIALRCTLGPNVLTIYEPLQWKAVLTGLSLALSFFIICWEQQRRCCVEQMKLSTRIILRLLLRACVIVCCGNGKWTAQAGKRVFDGAPGDRLLYCRHDNRGRMLDCRGRGAGGVIWKCLICRTWSGAAH